MKAFAACLLLAIAAVLLLSATGQPAAAVEVDVIAGGGKHTCILTDASGVKCWGLNTSGQLGDGTVVNRTRPVDVDGLTNRVAAISAGFDHTCAMTANGRARCWGRNDGRLGGLAPDGMARTTPLDVCADDACVTSLSNVDALAAGGSHTCALLRDGSVKCWGNNEDGQLGNGTRTRSPTPVEVGGLADVVAVGAGTSHTCALTAAGAVVCWGSNGEGQIGDERACGMRCSAPSPVTGLDSGVAAISVAGLHACALTTGGAVRCWGFNFDGQVGTGTSGTIYTTPANVSGLDSGVAAISANGGFRGHTCALTSAGRLQCWGDNAEGQLGDGSTTDRYTPVEVPGLSDVVRVAAGDAHTCALTGAGEMLCWGNNASGQLGDGTNTDRTSPVPVAGLAETPGDANCDGSVNSIDAALVLQFSARLLVSLACAGGADADLDGDVDAIDAALILQFTAGLLNSLPP